MGDQEIRSCATTNSKVPIRNPQIRNPRNPWRFVRESPAKGGEARRKGIAPDTCNDGPKRAWWPIA
eukprot:13602686-Alexandrium_andersonii.AAC.1